MGTAAAGIRGGKAGPAFVNELAAIARSTNEEPRMNNGLWRGAAFQNLLLLLCCCASLAHSQDTTRVKRARDAQTSKRIPVTVILMREDDTSAGAVIQRRADLAPHDLILLQRSSNDQQLSAAFHTLLVARSVEGDTSGVSHTLRVAPGQRRFGLGRSEVARVAGVLNRLRSADPVPIEGIGTLPAIELWLPSRAMREKRGGPGLIKPSSQHTRP
jgi:hypothetical protein